MNKQLQQQIKDLAIALNDLLVVASDEDEEFATVCEGYSEYLKIADLSNALDKFTR